MLSAWKWSVLCVLLLAFFGSNYMPCIQPSIEISIFHFKKEVIDLGSFDIRRRQNISLYGKYAPSAPRTFMKRPDGFRGVAPKEVALGLRSKMWTDDESFIYPSHNLFFFVFNLLQKRGKEWKKETWQSNFKKKYTEDIQTFTRTNRKTLTALTCHNCRSTLTIYSLHKSP